MDEDTAERKAVVNSIVMDATGIRQNTLNSVDRKSFIEIINQSEDEKNVNSVLLNNKSGLESIDIKSEHGNAVNRIYMQDKRGPQSGPNSAGIEISSMSAKDDSISNGIDMNLESGKEKVLIESKNGNSVNRMLFDTGENRKIELLNSSEGVSCTLLLDSNNQKISLVSSGENNSSRIEMDAKNGAAEISDSFGNSIVMKDGATTVTAESILLRGKGQDADATQRMVLGDLLLERLNNYIDTFNKHVHPTGTGPSGLTDRIESKMVETEFLSLVHKIDNRPVERIGGNE